MNFILLLTILTSNLEIQSVTIVSRAWGDDSSTPDAKEVLTIEPVIMLPLIKAVKDGQRTYICPDSSVEINGRRLENVAAWPKDEPIQITWYKVESEFDCYSNGVGYDFAWTTIDYMEHAFASGWFAWADVTPSYLEITEPRLIKNKHGRIIGYDSTYIYPFAALCPRTGTMHYKVQVVFKGDTFSSPGSESIAYYGITDKVHRVSKRPDNSIVGFATSFMNLPYIWASAGVGRNHQADRYIGADCADLITFAYRRYLEHRGRPIDDIYYTWGRALVNFGDIIVPLGKVIRGYPEGIFFLNGEPITYGEDGVKDGDVVLIYSTVQSPYPWHVGMLAGDRSSPAGPHRGKPNGLFDAFDLCMHTLGAPPCIQPMGRWGICCVIVRLDHNDD